MRGTSWLARFGVPTLFITLAVFACKKDPAPEDTPPTGFGGDGGPGGLSSTSSSSGSTSSSGGDANASSSSGYVPVYTNQKAQTMQFEGATRDYVLGIPKDYDAQKKYPVVMSFHGDGGNGAGQANGLPFETVSKGGAVLVYPSGIGATWNLYDKDNSDMRWIKALVSEVATKANIDTSKVFGFGYSNGAFFLTQMTCRNAGVFKAISSNAGGGPDDPDGQVGLTKKANDCLVCPAGPIPTIVIHGDADQGVPWSSGDFTATCIAETNGCSDSRSAATPAPCQSHDNCPAASPVKWCLIPGLNHWVWNQGMSESWAFFNALP